MHGFSYCTFGQKGHGLLPGVVPCFPFHIKPGSSTPKAKGTAPVMRSGAETTINLDVSGVAGESARQVYIVDSLGKATLLGTLAVTLPDWTSNHIREHSSKHTNG